jgi:hypothetical protein
LIVQLSGFWQEGENQMNLTSVYDAFQVVMKPVSDRFNASLDIFNVSQIWLLTRSVGNLPLINQL